MCKDMQKYTHWQMSGTQSSPSGALGVLSFLKKFAKCVLFVVTPKGYGRHKIKSQCGPIAGWAV